MVKCKQKNLIVNIIANKAINADKKWDTIADKVLNTTVDKSIDANKKQNAVAN